MSLKINKNFLWSSQSTIQSNSWAFPTIIKTGQAGQFFVRVFDEIFIWIINYQLEKVDANSTGRGVNNVLTNISTGRIHLLFISMRIVTSIKKLSAINKAIFPYQISRVEKRCACDIFTL